MSRLWDKGQPLDQEIHAFTVGDDPHWDLHLLHWDCVGSAAHARVLQEAGLLSETECAQLRAALVEISQLAATGQFAITAAQEDCHTAIEERLTERCGDAGRKIHTGRSRNDQVATAMRLFMRAEALGWVGALARFASAALQRIERDGELPMPGFTHMQRAMPSSIGQWLHATVEAAIEQMRAALDLVSRLDQCPLGSGAGFGVPLPLDRELAARLLGFARAQRSPVDVQNSRGRLETYFVRVAADVGAMLERLATDVVLFCGSEFGFVRLPTSLTTGSSIMPQKRNPDVAELLRARGARLRAWLSEVEWVRAKLPSNYHRDLQLTKAPTIRTAGETDTLLRIATVLVEAMEFDAPALQAACTHELYATGEALRLVQSGVPFRDAYRRVAAQFAQGGATFEMNDADRRAAIVTPAVQCELAAEIAQLAQAASDRRARDAALEQALLM